MDPSRAAGFIRARVTLFTASLAKAVTLAMLRADIRGLRRVSHQRAEYYTRWLERMDDNLHDHVGKSRYLLGDSRSARSMPA